MKKYKSYTGVRDYIRRELKKNAINLPSYMFSYNVKTDELRYSRLMAGNLSESLPLSIAIKSLGFDVKIVDGKKDMYGYSYSIYIENLSQYLEKDEKAEALKTPKVGDVFLCKRYFNSKRIIYVPSRLVSIGEKWATLKDLELNDEYSVIVQTLNNIKPISKSWIDNKITRLKFDKAFIELEISNLEKL